VTRAEFLAPTPEACERLGIDRDRLRRCLSRHCRGTDFTTSTAPVDLDPTNVDPTDIELIRDAATRLGLISGPSTGHGRSTGTPRKHPHRSIQTPS
jgi:hypothetical protein